MIPQESYLDVVAFFDWDPKLLVGERALPPWERRLTAIKIPEPLVFGGAPVYTVRVHAKVAALALSALQELHARGLWYLLNPYGGSYNFRLARAAGLRTRLFLTAEEAEDWLGIPHEGSS